ncbi:Exodeoxyribonuclease 1 protein [Rutstroemia sp. NJR-2017a BBW]|nr:Exodeoxyribonuclease 1 protein [Rutstroemia sp. NJR-2017a BBW]
MDLAMGKQTRKYVDYCMHRVRMLQHFGVTPFLIFDGDYLPSKAATEKDREKRRLESTRSGQELLRAGKASQAYLEFQKAVDVTPEMARHVIDELKKVGVQYIVAPYEADAQMQRIVVDQKDKTVTSYNYSTTQFRSLSTNDLKKGVSIGNYFKPLRRPLAELDVNCFTTSQSQQELLSRASGQWIADPVRPYLQRSTTQPEPELPPHSVSRAARPVGRRLNSLNETRPPKRARLCEDDDILQTSDTDQKVELGRSRFFASAPQDDSPSALKVSKQRKSRKKDDITIFSDDSIEEAMLSLPDDSGFLGKKTPKVHVYKDNDKAASPPMPSLDSRTSPTPSQSSAASSTNKLAEQRPVSSLERSNLVPGDLKSRFSYSTTAISTPKPVTKYGLPTPPSSSAPYQSKIPVPVKSTPTTSVKSSITSNKSMLTPLQRLGAAASNRFKMPPTPPLTPMLANGPLACLRQGSVPFPEVEVKTKKITSVEPASIPLPSVDELETIALSTGKGSEDLIVPDSEEEYEPLSPVEGSTSGGLALGLNLERFSYAG